MYFTLTTKILITALRSNYWDLFPATALPETVWWERVRGKKSMKQHWHTSCRKYYCHSIKRITGPLYFRAVVVVESVSVIIKPHLKKSSAFSAALWVMLRHLQRRALGLLISSRKLFYHPSGSADMQEWNKITFLVTLMTESIFITSSEFSKFSTAETQNTLSSKTRGILIFALDLPPTSSDFQQFHNII